MGWFDEQIKQRIKMDDEAFDEAFVSMADVVMGSHLASSMKNSRFVTKDAVDEILRFYHIKPIELPKGMDDFHDQLEYLMEPFGLMRRVVSLEGTWYKDAVGAFLATRKDNGEVVALIPHKLSGYVFFDRKSGKQIRVRKATAAIFLPEALSFYKAMPLKKLAIPDLLFYIIQMLSILDYFMIAFSTLAATLLGMLLPKLNYILFSDVISSGSSKFFFAVATMFLSVTIVKILITTVKNMVMSRIQTKSSMAVQSAAMMRLFSLPVEFFKQYSSGELSTRTQSINNLCNMLFSAILSSGLTSLFSLLYITQIFSYAAELVIPSMIIILTTMAVSLLTTLANMKVARRTMEINAKESGLIYSLITGVQKIKLSGSEKRAFSKWAGIYKEKAKLMYDPPILVKLSPILSMAVSLFGTILLYSISIQAELDVAEYYSFYSAYGMVMGAFLSLSSISNTIAGIKPVLELVKPILQALPEVSAGKKMVERISGNIELNQVSFRYKEGMPFVVENLSLKIKSGQYVAIVGETGCGKSTLMRLLLGFETPHKGAIYYDGKDITSIDLKSLRRKIGVVMQNGKLFLGDIFSNITISAPWLTMEEAFEAAELAGIAEDIRDMPMGMHTMISEGAGGISGGQRQRLMIARAIAPKPRVLMFDEATSALDNLTQKTVSKSLNELKCTRIIIAHRLSTIKECDRILVLHQGKIIEDGTYLELIEKKGYFAELVARQQ